jgi:micrococcal nuclease
MKVRPVFSAARWSALLFLGGALLAQVGTRPAAAAKKTPLAPIRQYARVVRVIAGDTLTVLYQGQWQELKLIGVSVPEPVANDQTYVEALRRGVSPETVLAIGRQAREWVSQRLRYGSQVWLEFDTQPRDRVGRILAYVYLSDGRMLNILLLRHQFASLQLLPPNLRYRGIFQQEVAPAPVKPKM